MRRFVGWLAPRLARTLLALAVTVLLLGVALVALGVHVSAWPYRRVYGPSRRRLMFQAGLDVLGDLAALGALARPPKKPVG